MALDREREIARVHAGAVVGDADEGEAASRRDDFDLASAGVDGVLDEFLDDARRPLDDLAGSDAVDRLRCELADSHQSHNPRPRLASQPVDEWRRRAIWRGARA